MEFLFNERPAPVQCRKKPHEAEVLKKKAKHTREKQQLNLDGKLCSEK